MALTLGATPDACPIALSAGGANACSSELGRPIRLLVMISSMEGGGSERQVCLLLKHLDRRRFAPELYLLRRVGSLLDEVPTDVPIHSFEEASQRAVWRWSMAKAKLASWIERLPLPGSVHRQQVADVSRILVDRQIDVIYDRTFHMTLIAGPAAEIAGVPRVSTIVSPPSHAVPLNAGRFLAIKKRRLRNAYRQAAAVITVSHPTRQDAAAFYQLPLGRFVVIANPVDAAMLDQAIAASPVPSRDQRYTIACVGRISIEKGQWELIQALKWLRDEAPGNKLPKVWMIGDGPLRKSLEQLATAERLGDSIEFLGHVTEPAAWIAAADAVCIPSHFEGFPNVMLESMAIGVPVIARSIEVVRSLGRLSDDPTIRGRCYLTTFNNATENTGRNLACKIVKTQENSTATRSKTLAAKRLARETLSISNGIARIEQILIKAVFDGWRASNAD